MCRPYCRSMWACLALCVVALTVQAEDELPPAAEVYLGRTIARTMHYTGAPWLVRESREREEECSTLLKALTLQPGNTVCDMGCGNGFYSLQMARLVGENGRVLAVDIQPEMLRLLEARAETVEIGNIHTILGTIIDPKLPAGSVDLCLLVDVYHEFSHPVQMLAAIRRSLQPKGRVALVEFRLEDPDVPIKLLHKMNKTQMLKEFEANQFKLVGQFDKLPWQHVMFFARDDSPLPAVEPTDWPIDRTTPAVEAIETNDAAR
ncbi:MAG: methyltransferase domain-containing protein [Planctomycetales bacterium]|nr:methyltransferase domain-containing protein [Planctomycetales bacterium]